MKALKLLAALAICHALATTGAIAQKKTGEYEPVDGMAGKDVTWVGTDISAVNQMLDLAGVTDKDYVIDLGSGDGRMIIYAAKRGAQGLGIEYNTKLVDLSKQIAAREKVADKAKFIKADIFKSDFSKATVVMMYLLPDLNRKLRPKILKLKPGTRVTSIAFDMGTWKPDKQQTTKSCKMDDGCTAYLWIVPARAAGRWKLAGGVLTLKQKFQELTGNYILKGKRETVSNAKLEGQNITFSFGNRTYSGKVNGKSMSGTSTANSGGASAPVNWQASKVDVRKRS